MTFQSNLSVHLKKKEIVELLLTHNADLNIKNNEGLKPKDIVTDPAIKKLLQGMYILI